MLVSAQTFGLALIELPAWMTVIDLIQASLELTTLYPEAHASFDAQVA
jgi:hypothetical protein